jgi:hypothetical protein
VLWLPGAALVLLSPFRAGAADILQLWPVRFEWEKAPAGANAAQSYCLRAPN